VVVPYRNGNDRYAAGQHRGLDIAAPLGSSVLAIVDGRVSFSSRLPDGGQTVTIASADGRWLISHLHLSVRSVSRGETVRVGQALGRVGTTGKRSSDAPHLHLGVRRASDRAYVDPMELLGAPRTPLASTGQSKSRAAHPQVHALERPARVADQNVRAPQTGDSSSTTRHGAEDGRTARVRSVDASAREGHAADGISRVAPPPISEEPRRASFAAEEPAPVDGTPEAVPSEAQPAQSAGNNTRRLLLLAVAAACIATLLLRARRPSRRPTAPPAATETADQSDPDVVPIRRVG
jgi:hypothetical protein